MYFHIAKIWIFAILGSTLAYDVSDFNNSYTQFSDQLVKTIADSKKGNFVVSPLSISRVLNVLSYGARGETLKEITTNLHMPAPNPETLRAIKQFQKELTGEPNATVRVLNRVYVSQDFKLKPRMESLINKNSTALLVQRKDFASPTLRGEINEWVERRTEGTIKNAVETLNSNTAMLVLNVLYFKSKWEGFIEAKKNLTFHLSDGTEVKVPTIQNEKISATSFNNGTLRISSIPYINENFQMILVMPKKNGQPAPSLSESLELLRDPDWIYEGDIELYLPKSLIETKHDLVPIMKTMGAESMFSPHSADFSNFGPGDLHVSSFIQKAYIRINNEGVEASASTQSQLSFRIGVPEVKFDRPFFAYITYKSMPLFATRVSDPRDK